MRINSRTRSMVRQETGKDQGVAHRDREAREYTRETG